AGAGLVFGYEEALGYSVGPDVVRDKDGISAALLVAELAAGLRARGATLLDRLDELAREHGLHATDQYSARVEDADLITAAMARLRAEPPSQLAGRAVTRVRDLLEDSGRLPSADVLVFELDGGRVVVRPSGTEPKLKAYLETVVPEVGDPSDARDLAKRRLAHLKEGVASVLAL
nr:phospho-sugar mutase [Solirubrobacterales bacterium]